MISFTFWSAVPDRKGLKKKNNHHKELQQLSLTQQRAHEDDNLHGGGEVPVALLLAVLLSARLADIPALPHHLPGRGVPHLQSSGDSLGRGMVTFIHQHPASVVPHGEVPAFLAATEVVQPLPLMNERSAQAKSRF